MPRYLFQVIMTRHEEDSERRTITKMVGNYYDPIEAEEICAAINNSGYPNPWLASVYKVRVL